MDKDFAWVIVILLGIVVFQLGDMNSKMKRCAGLLADCAN